MAKHSGQEARVTLRGKGQQIELTIEDSGTGFDPEISQRPQTLGLVSMRERVRFVDGKIAIRSELSNGTRIDVQNSASFESACP